MIRFAFEVAQIRPKKHITVGELHDFVLNGKLELTVMLVTKSNAQRNGMVMWDEVAAEVAKDFPDVTMDKMLVDAMTCRMVLQPNSLDTIVATNLVGQVCFEITPYR